MRGCETGGEGKKRDGEGICDGTGIETHFFAINNAEYERARDREEKNERQSKKRKKHGTSTRNDQLIFDQIRFVLFFLVADIQLSGCLIEHRLDTLNF